MRYLLLFLLFSSSLMANLPPHRFEVGPDFFYRTYSEKGLQDGAKSDEYGMLYGVQMAYNFVAPSTPYFGAELRIAGGKTVYDGSLVNKFTGAIRPYMSHTLNEIVDGELRAGYSFNLENRIWTPFIGIGYHFWHRDLSFYSPYGYAEDYSWNYISVGTRSEYPLSRFWMMGVNIKLMFPFNGRMKCNDLWGTVFHLGSVVQTEIELPFTYKMRDISPTSYLRLIPYFQNQDIGCSDTQIVLDPDLGYPISYFEPSSETYVFGLRIEYLKSF